MLSIDAEHGVTTEQPEQPEEQPEEEGEREEEEEDGPVCRRRQRRVGAENNYPR